MSEVLLSELERSSRIDAEFYAKENLAFLSKLEKFTIQSITNFVRVSDGNHMSISESFSEMGIPYYRGQDIHHNFIENSSPICINEATYSLPVMSRSHLKKGDILLSIVGTIGGLSLVTTNNKATCSCKLAILRPKKGVNPNTIFIFLKSKYGQNQIKKFTRGAVQMGLILEDMDQIKIPNFSSALQNKIGALVSSAFEKLQKSKEAYQTAQNLLLEHLDLKDFNPPTQTVNIKSFTDSFGTSGRLDAEFYQEKYDVLIQKMKSQEYDRLKNLVSIKKSIEPGSSAYDEQGLPFIRVSDYDKFQISSPAKYLSDAYCQEYCEILKNLQPKKGTILFSKDGTVGIAHLLSKDLDGITSGAILHLKVKDKRILPEYLTLVLNSLAVQMQAERDVGGSIIQHWRVEEIKEVVIPIISMEAQTQIADLIRQSKCLRQESQALLEEAKRKVEQAIES